MGFWKDIKELRSYNKQKREKKEQRKKEVNQNPTEEELKNNKKGKLSYLLSFISLVMYVAAFFIIAKAFQENAIVGFLAIAIVLSLGSLLPKKAVSLAKEQRKINGKGSFALVLAHIVPVVCVFGIVFFFIFSLLYL